MDGAFSKLAGVKLEDEDDERQSAWEAASAQYKAAQDSYAAKGAGHDALKAFEDAEARMSPLMGNGLVGLRECELEALLKGRLHRAAITAHLSDLPDRWTRVKRLTEDVLQFDFNNCHARWLRGLSLLHGFNRRSEARDEMTRAVACARTTGKIGECTQWEEEIRFHFKEDNTAAVDAAVATEIHTPTSAPDAGPVETELPRRKASTGASDVSSTKLKGGFFTKKASARSATQVAALAQVADPVQVSASPQAASATGVYPSHSRRETELEEELRSLRENTAHCERELQGEVRSLKAELDVVRCSRNSWRDSVSQAVERLSALASEADGAVQETVGSSPATAPLTALDVSLGELREKLLSDKAWGEATHQKFMDLSTEVATLREMSFREARERQDSSKQNLGEVRELTKRLGDLKSSVKALRDGIRQRVPDSRPEVEVDSQQLVESIAEFKSLSPSVKFWALLDDASVLRLLIIVVALGMLFALALFVETYSARRCRFVCAR